MKSQQSSHSGASGPGLVNVVQGSPGDKASKRKAQGDKSGGGGGKRGPYQRWEFLVDLWKKYANISFQCNANIGLQSP